MITPPLDLIMIDTNSKKNRFNIMLEMEEFRIYFARLCCNTESPEDVEESNQAYPTHQVPDWFPYPVCSKFVQFIIVQLIC